jgi:hypothetical protein
MASMHGLFMGLRVGCDIGGLLTSSTTPPSRHPRQYRTWVDWLMYFHLYKDSVLQIASQIISSFLYSSSMLSPSSLIPR